MSVFSGTRIVCMSIAATLSWADIAVATPVSIDYFAWDSRNAGVAGEFDLVNEVEPNGSSDATRPVDSALSLSNLSLVVLFSDGTTVTFGAAYLQPSGRSVVRRRSDRHRRRDAAVISLASFDAGIDLHAGGRR